MSHDALEDDPIKCASLSPIFGRRLIGSAMRLASNAAPTRRSAHQAIDVESMLAAYARFSGRGHH